jgi:hypothetical protein
MWAEAHVIAGNLGFHPERVHADSPLEAHRRDYLSFL